MVRNPDLTEGTSQGARSCVIADLVTRARNGHNPARDALVKRYAPLIWPICRRHGLGCAGTHDVGQSVWLSIPAGGIAPSRRGCLEELRSHLSMTALINPDAGTAA